MVEQIIKRYYHNIPQVLKRKHFPQNLITPKITSAFQIWYMAYN